MHEYGARVTITRVDNPLVFERTVVEIVLTREGNQTGESLPPCPSTGTRIDLGPSCEVGYESVPP